MRRGIILLGVIVLTGLGGVVVGRSAPPATTQAIASKADDDAGLNRMVASVDFKETPLDEAVDSLRDQTKTNLVVDWAALEAAGIDRKSPISVRLNKLPLSRVLEVCLDLTGGVTVSLGYKADRGVIRVT